MYHEIERGCDQAIVIGETIVRVVDVEGTCVTLAVSRPNGRPRYQKFTVDLAEQEFTALAGELSLEISSAR